MKAKGTITYLREAIANCENTIKELSDDKNPQIQAIVAKTIAEKRAFVACLASLQGNHIPLSLHGPSTSLS